MKMGIVKQYKKSKEEVYAFMKELGTDGTARKLYSVYIRKGGNMINQEDFKEVLEELVKEGSVREDYSAIRIKERAKSAGKARYSAA